MKPKSNFLIKKREYFDEYGKSSHHYYYVLEHKKILWWSYWKDIFHEECYDSGTYKTRTKFDTQEDAEKFVREVMCPGKIREGSVETVVNEIVCINGKSKF